ncbi:hypothetical protein [Microcella alkaliphila]|jgi:hypothetical protein|uniref:Uncharacterized protein n=1 Tax=Microcella alkaliphila TaxID=279828 RepID=A0A0U5BSS5_9MICO|nr:hypothetical protein [Microcella alkaliphila]BAU33430.1 uncharacterized protein MalAC0309_2595 [Microcella alkaliphila]
MTKLLAGTAVLFGLSVLGYTMVVVVTGIFRANGMDFWPGTSADNNWPAAVGYASLAAMPLTAALCVLLLISIGIRAALRHRHDQDRDDRAPAGRG